MAIPLQLASLYGGQVVFVWSDCLLDLGTDFLVGLWFVFKINRKRSRRSFVVWVSLATCQIQSKIQPRHSRFPLLKWFSSAISFISTLSTLSSLRSGNEKLLAVPKTATKSFGQRGRERLCSVTKQRGNDSARQTRDTTTKI